jgi:hypothetical protein
VTLLAGCEVSASVNDFDVSASEMLSVVFERVTPGSVANAGEANGNANRAINSGIIEYLVRFFFIRFRFIQLMDFTVVISHMSVFVSSLRVK